MVQKVLIIDNYDSFTYNLAHYVHEFVDEVIVQRNDAINIDAIHEYSKIILSPGPSLPKDAGNLMTFLQHYYNKKSILGVCLGMQAIGEFFGATLTNLSQVFHGLETNIIVSNNNEKIYKDIPPIFKAGRYHSWVISKENFPSNLEITAVDEHNSIMSVRHKQYDITGVQYHPESIMTEYGKQILHNWICYE